MTINEKSVVIFDIDGTLADNSHRQHLVTDGSLSWKHFFEQMGDDQPVWPLIDLCKILAKSPEYSVLIFSGRPDNYRKLTEQWLAWNDVPSVPLMMRQAGDHRPDDVVKQEMLDALLAQNKTIAFVVDDRRSVVDMWRRNGVICLQCADNNF